MVVDLGPLPYRKAMELVRWCAEHDVDGVKARQLIHAMSIVEQDPDLVWELDIPDEYMTYFSLKWSC